MKTLKILYVCAALLAAVMLLFGCDTAVNGDSGAPPETTVPGGEEMPNEFITNWAFMETVINADSSIAYTKLDDSRVSVPLTEDNLEKIRNITSLSLMYVTDVTGLKYFTGLTDLSITQSSITELDVSSLTKLTTLVCSNNADLGELDVSSLTSLTDLDCSWNDLWELDVSSLTSLTSLDCSGNKLLELDVSSLTSLKSLNCSYNYGLIELNVSLLTSLTTLDCSWNTLRALDVSSLTSLTDLNCSHNALTELDVSSLTSLTSLDCDENFLTELDVSKLLALETLRCGNQKNINGGGKQTLTLTISKDQENLWNNEWKDNYSNENVELADYV